jgi:hypothetical protein
LKDLQTAGVKAGQTVARLADLKADTTVGCLVDGMAVSTAVYWAAKTVDGMASTKVESMDFDSAAS